MLIESWFALPFRKRSKVGFAYFDDKKIIWGSDVGSCSLLMELKFKCMPLALPSNCSRSQGAVTFGHLLVLSALTENQDNGRITCWWRGFLRQNKDTSTSHLIIYCPQTRYQNFDHICRRTLKIFSHFNMRVSEVRDLQNPCDFCEQYIYMVSKYTENCQALARGVKIHKKWETNQPTWNFSWNRGRNCLEMVRATAH